jgi:D-glycero-D-manno-heptose 1,7-bisphosphate phosphatase
LLHQLAEHYGVPLDGVPLIGDSARDIEAALAVAARPILVMTGNGAKARAVLEPGSYEVCPDLLAAARLLAGELGY